MLGESLHLLPCNSCWITTTLSAVNRNRRRTSLPSRRSRESHRKHKRLAIAAAASMVIDTGSVQLQQASPETQTPASDSEQFLPRRLILLRHAHSSWENRSLRDHDRPLSKAGQLAAAKVSHELWRLGWIPGLILCSDAVRTRETLKIMQEQVPAFLEAEVHFLSSFYSVAAMDGQTAEHLRQAICKYSKDDILTVMCMGHNRGWEEAASMFSGAPIELKTCNAALLEATGKSWEETFSLAGLGGWGLQGIVKPDTDV
ncbi:uncharacterized protein At3g52155, chloroplastic [Ipomoea triloba]|uniref:uncharacterized protein At3g52155, chloroplastic n=1 Tax=Ipomoea triloba TaxID=35885 RepID=UPI00125DB424|nr:uncharacterized protein At3g52155, chloroplastic [Ipomoea triloba]